MGKEFGFDEASCHLLATVAVELARNILKYAGTGHLLVRSLSEGGREGIEIQAKDRGPGIANVEEALVDGFSSGGTLGLGLPGIRRIMDELEIESSPQGGTCIVARKWQRSTAAR